MINQMDTVVDSELKYIFKDYKIELNFHKLTSTSRTYVFKDNTSLNNKDRHDKTKQTLIHLKQCDKALNIVELYNGVQFNIKGTNIKIKIMFKPSTAKQEDPHELMTASCILYGPIDITCSCFNPDALIKKLKTIVKNKIKDYNPKILNAFDCSYTVLAQSISASNTILKNNPSVRKDTKRKVIIDSTKWDFPHWIRAYNSSDFVIKYDKDKYLGISLKKRISKKTTPTLINKSCDDFIENIVDETLEKKLKSQKIKFCQLVLDTLGIPYTDDNLMEHYVKQCNSAQGRRAIKSLLVSKDNCYFKMIDKILKSQKERFVTSILKLAFRYELKTLKSKQFSFALVIGTGEYRSFTFIVKEGKYESINNSIRRVNAILKEGNFNLVKMKDRKHAFEKGATAEKLFYTILSNKKPIMRLELRYKGMYNRNPSFFAYLLE